MARRDAEELSPTEATLLGLLAHGGKAMSGYDLLRASRQTVGVMWTPTKGHLYAILPRLVEHGWATSREVSQPNRPTKHVYRITRKGRSALRRWLAAPAEPGQERDMLLLKIFFGDLGDRDALLEHVRRRRDEAEDLRKAVRSFERSDDDAPVSVYPSLTRRYALAWAQFTLRWAAEAEDALGAGRRRRPATTSDAPRRRATGARGT